MSENEAITTAFHEVTSAQGGSHIEDGGWMWLEGFGDVAKEYAAIRDDAAVWDVSPLNKWEFRGPDALRAAQRVFSNDALGLEVGQRKPQARELALDDHARLLGISGDGKAAEDRRRGVSSVPRRPGGVHSRVTEGTRPGHRAAPTRRAAAGPVVRERRLTYPARSWR